MHYWSVGFMFTFGGIAAVFVTFALIILWLRFLEWTGVDSSSSFTANVTVSSDSKNNNGGES